MPELPEVETIRRGLARSIVGKRIERVIIRKPKMVRGSARGFSARLRGASFSDVQRHGKLLILPLDKMHLLIHLKMTGQLIYRDKKHLLAGGHQWPPVEAGQLPNRYTHVQFNFSDGSTLYFNDLRQFGFLELVDQPTLDKRLAGMGVDPLLQRLTWEYFHEAVSGRSTSIKAILLNQQLIAGIGNIYADEICFAARVRPQRRGGSLTKREERAIWRAIMRVLQRALKHGGTTFRNYRDSDGGQGNFTRLLKVYGRSGRRCKRPTCQQASLQGVIKKIVVAGRGTHYCPICQV